MVRSRSRSRLELEAKRLGLGPQRLVCIPAGKPGLIGCPLDSQFPVIIILFILNISTLQATKFFAQYSYSNTLQTSQYSLLGKVQIPYKKNINQILSILNTSRLTMSSKKNQALASASSRVEPDDTTHWSTSSSCTSYKHSRMTDDITMVTTTTSISIIISITNLTICHGPLTW